MIPYKVPQMLEDHPGEHLEELQVWHHRDHGEGFRMVRRHRHNSVELNFILRGAVSYLRVGSLVQMPPRKLILFWGAMPHQVIGTDPFTDFYSIHLPLAWFLGGNLPKHFVERVLHGEVAIEPEPARDIADATWFQDWEHDLASGEEPRRELVLLEARARLQRLALSLAEKGDWNHNGVQHGAAPDLHKVERMADYVARHYTNDLMVTDVAKTVDLHPKYATQLFRRTCGLSLKEYITMNRVYHAQLLLVTTDAPIIDVALHSGFGSESRFYATFRTVCGESPRAYRARMRKGNRGNKSN